VNITKKYYQTIPLLLSATLLLTACNTSAPFDKTKNFQGVWEHKGYGTIISVKGKRAIEYEYTRQTCLKTSDITPQELEDFIAQVSLASDKKSFLITNDNIFSEARHKIDTLPSSCETSKLLNSSLPTQVFEHFWHNFNDYYAFFNERGIDWAQQYEMYRSQVTDNMSDKDLFNILAAMLKPTDDAHITLTAGEQSFSPSSNPDFIDEFIAEFDQQNEFTDMGAYLNHQYQQIKTLPDRYITGLKSAGGKQDDALSWGIVNGDIGYINIARMMRYTTKTTLDEDEEIYNELTAVNTLLDRVMSDLANIQSLIIDVRHNGGGYDAVSLAIANRFASQRQLVLSKYARSFAGNSPVVNAYLEPQNKSYTKPIAILTSQLTTSAAEGFLMAMSALANVTLIGEPSSGALSDILEKELPNGWSIGLSNEIYLDYLGRNYEVSGVLVDINIPAFSVTDVKQAKDSPLEKAVNLLTP